MSWPVKIKEKVLVKCGRHCCICHKFCGIKMELHHIKLRSAGGNESEENCIPLCFDCHADQSSYDKKHPKGTKYTETELKFHRDKWYLICENNLGTGVNDNLDQDIKTFDSLVILLPYEQVILFLKENTLGKTRISIDDHIRPLEKFAKSINNPWLDFFDSDLDASRMKLSNTIISLLEGIASYTYLYPFQGGGVWMHPQSFFRSDEDYYEKIREFDNIANEIVSNYNEFIRFGRSKLGK